MKINQSVPFFYDPGFGEMTSYADVMSQTQEVNEPIETPPTTEVVTEVIPETIPEVVPQVIPEVVKEVVPDWRETVTNEDLLSVATKKLDRNAFLKAAGLPDNLLPLVGSIDEETIKFLEFKAAGGDAHEYLRVKNTDYTKISDVQLLEMDIKEKYPNIDNKTFQIVLKRELLKYNLDREEFLDDSEEAIIGNFMLKEDTDKIRAKYIDKQNSLKAPERKPDTTAQDQQVIQQQVTNTVRNSETVKALQTNKILSYGEGDEAFNFDVKDVDQIVNAAISTAIQNGDAPSEADLQEMVSTFAIHANKKAFINAMIAHGKTLGERNLNKEVRNVTPGATTTTVQGGYKSAAEALAKEGRLVSHSELFGT